MSINNTEKNELVTQEDMIQYLVSKVRDVERDWRTEMGSDAPSFNYFDSLNLATSITEYHMDQTFYPLNIKLREQTGMNMLRQLDKDILREHIQHIDSLDKKELYAFLRGMDEKFGW